MYKKRYNSFGMIQFNISQYVLPRSALPKSAKLGAPYNYKVFEGFSVQDTVKVMS